MARATKKVLVADPEKCTGCAICTLVCSFRHNKEFNPSRALLTILRDQKQGVNIPIICQHCDNPLCMESCPTGAIYRDETTNAVCINQEKCIGCHQCLVACPFGGIHIDPVDGRTIKCDLCDGYVMCVQFCPRNALLYLEPNELTRRQQKEGIAKAAKYLQVISGGESK